MPRKRSTKTYSFFEPWHATKSIAHGHKPNVEGFPDEAGQALLAAWDRSDRDADWIIWGSKMAGPTVVTGFASGAVSVADDMRIIAVRRWLGLPEGSLGNEEVCKRIAECVNAMHGVADPAAFVEDVRALLLDYVQGENVDDPRTDVRFVSLLERCIPPEQLTQE